MSNGTAALIADALVYELGQSFSIPSGGWAQAFMPTRLWEPVTRLENIPSTPGMLNVIPDSMPSDTIATRNTQSQQHVIYLMLRAKLNDTTNASIDPWVQLLEQIKDWFFSDRHFLVSSPALSFQAWCDGAEVPTWCWRPYLQQYQAYTGVAALTFQCRK